MLKSTKKLLGIVCQFFVASYFSYISIRLEENEYLKNQLITSHSNLMLQDPCPPFPFLTCISFLHTDSLQQLFNLPGSQEHWYMCLFAHCRTMYKIALDCNTNPPSKRCRWIKFKTSLQLFLESVSLRLYSPNTMLKS